MNEGDKKTTRLHARFAYTQVHEYIIVFYFECEHIARMGGLLVCLHEHFYVYSKILRFILLSKSHSLFSHA